MASHSREELREAARTLGRAALEAGFRPGAGVPAVAAPAAAGRVFDFEQDGRRAA
jgi:glycine C-acetyltransferase/8-amino-7-oxononanoate synthase